MSGAETREAGEGREPGRVRQREEGDRGREEGGKKERDDKGEK